MLPLWTSVKTVGLLVLATGLVTAVAIRADLFGEDAVEQLEAARAVLDDIGEPDEALVLAWREASDEELEKRLAVLQQGRLASLRLLVEAVEKGYEVGANGFTMEVVMRAHLKLAQAELEYSQNPADRIEALRKLVECATRIEDDIRAKRIARAIGGSEDKFYEAIHARLSAEEQLAREHLAQRSSPQPPSR